MKLDYLSDMSDGGRFKQIPSDNLARLSDFNELEAKHLQTSILKTILERKNHLDLSSLNFIDTAFS
jgi:hypothetical protein